MRGFWSQGVSLKHQIVTLGAFGNKKQLNSILDFENQVSFVHQSIR